MRLGGGFSADFFDAGVVVVFVVAPGPGTGRRFFAFSASSFSFFSFSAARLAATRLAASSCGLRVSGLRVFGVDSDSDSSSEMTSATMWSSSSLSVAASAAEMSVPAPTTTSTQTDGELEHKKSVSCEEEPSEYVDTALPPDLADAGVVARDNAGFLAEPAGPRIPGAPLALPVGLASLSQQVSPCRLESSRVGLAFPTARRRGAGGFDAGLSGVFERACLARRASSVASSGVKG